MSATPPSNLVGTQSPSSFEVLWERYKSLIMTIIAALLLALVGNYAWQYSDQKALDEKWSQFNVSIGLEETYTETSALFKPMDEILEGLEWSGLEAAMNGADDSQRPYFMLAKARKAMNEEKWAEAADHLATLKQSYPDHPLVVVSKSPIQSRDLKEFDEGEEPDEPMPEPALEGSAVSLMLAEIEKAKGFQLPASFQKSEVPADAKKVKFTFGDYGSVTFALMPSAPEHSKKFLELAQQDGGFWKDVAVDQIQRATDTNKRIVTAMHFGYTSTKDDDRTSWSTKEPSEHLLDWEETGLSHFEGAISANAEADGKSCADRIWVQVDDNPANDGQRVVFGYVVEGLEVIQEICEAGMSAEEEDRGNGRPTENIRVTEVEVL